MTATIHHHPTPINDNTDDNIDNGSNAPIDWFASPASLLSALTRDIRSDGVKYWRFSDRACMDMPGELNEFFYELHDTEGPNDWRYETIVNILGAIIDKLNYLENVPEGTYIDDPWLGFDMILSEEMADVYTSDLAAWYADHSNRCFYHDKVDSEGLIKDGASLFDRMQAGQARAIQIMVEKITNRFDICVD